VRLSVLVKFGALMLASVSPTVLHAQQVIFPADGAQGSPGTAGSVGGPDGTDGGPGGPGGTITNSNTINRNTNNQTTVLGTANGGNGGNGGDDSGLDPDGGNGGAGGQGGSVTVTNSGNLTNLGNSSGKLSGGFVVRANGGDGGSGGTAGGILTGAGNGGNGGQAGTANGTSSGIIITTDNINPGILIQADGGRGNNGGSAGGLTGYGGSGGAGASGGTAIGTNNGSVSTQGRFSEGLLVRAAGGVGGTGGTGSGIIAKGGNGGPATVGGTAEGYNRGTLATTGEFSSGMVVESIGGAGGSGSEAFGLFGGGGAGAAGNNGGSALGVNSGTITTNNNASYGMLVQSVGGGGGNGGGAAALVALGGKAGGGGEGGIASGRIGGSVNTGNGNGSVGVIVQSIGGGGGDGGWAGGVAALGGSGAGGGQGGAVNITAEGPGLSITTQGAAATGLIAQSIGGGGGNGGLAFAFAVPALPIPAIAIGGSAGLGSNGGKVNVQLGAGSINTSGSKAIGLLAQSIGGGGGNGGLAVSINVVNITGALSVGGKGGGGGSADEVKVNVGLNITTLGDNAHGIQMQSVGGGGGNGGAAVGVNLTGVIAIAVGGEGSGGGNGGFVTGTSGGNIDTNGKMAFGIFAQSVGGGGGDGGWAGAGSTKVGFSLGGKGGKAGNGGAVDVTSNGKITTRGDYAVGFIAQSVGGGGGNGGAAATVSSALGVGLGGSGGAAGVGENVTARANGDIETSGIFAAGILAQSVGGGGGNATGSFVMAGGSFSIGGDGAAGNKSGIVNVFANGNIKTRGENSQGILAQSVGGGGGNGGFAISITTSTVPSFAIAGRGDNGGDANAVLVGNLSSGIMAQSIGGGGGNGGFAAATSVTASLAIGGAGKNGGKGDTVDVKTNSLIHTRGNLSHGIIAQSIGGGGGNGGTAASLNVGIFNAGVGIGGDGGSGNFSKKVTVVSRGNITTEGQQSRAILAQSIGGSGGNGGDSYVGTFNLSPIPTIPGGALSVAVGGSGGKGNDGGEVSVAMSGVLNATGAFASGGVVAQSIGGGGGNGGGAYSMSAGVNSLLNASISVGGSGGGGGDGKKVGVEGTNGRISTIGTFSSAIIAQSIGGGGGNGGEAYSYAGGAPNPKLPSVKVSVSVGGRGGVGGLGGDVTVTNSMELNTSGFASSGILAESIGGGGGTGGASESTANTTGKASVGFNVVVDVGGGGGTGNHADIVKVTNSGVITTTGDYGYGIYARSIGGGGGTGGASAGEAENDSATPNSFDINAAIGGWGGAGGDGKLVEVKNSANITTNGFGAGAIVAQSVGAGGGNGGAASAKNTSSGKTQTTGSVAFALGGYGDAAGQGGDVNVFNSAKLETIGRQANGITAISIGGGGGIGGAASASSEGKYNLGGGIGGDGGDGKPIAANKIGGSKGNGNTVYVKNEASGLIITNNDESHGILASSTGAGGGAGGLGSGTGEAEKGGVLTVSVGIGGAAGSAGDGGIVTVDNLGSIYTFGNQSTGILAESIGGGGGAGGGGSADRGADNKATVSIGGGFGRPGGSSGAGKLVTVNTSGTAIETKGFQSHGVLAQSIGGGGGTGGAGNANAASGQYEFVLGVGATGGSAGTGGQVDVNTSSNIITRGNSSNGIIAQSIGGGGGVGGAGGVGNVASKDGATDNDGKNKSKLSLGAGIGKGGGASGSGGNVTVKATTGGSITTVGSDSHGIFAQSVGAGGGVAGQGSSALGKGEYVINFAMGGGGGSSGNGGIVKVTSDQAINTFGDISHGIFAQSLGGGGGAGGGAVGKAVTDAKATLNIGAGLAGSGGASGFGELVEVTNNLTGFIHTRGFGSHGIFGQSIGGGGGAGGASGTQQKGGQTAITASIGGEGSGGGKGGTVNITNAGTVLTDGASAYGIFGQSVGGGGGAGGAGGARSEGGTDYTFTIGMGKAGGDGGAGGSVTVRNLSTGVIETVGEFSTGIVAQSVGGGGGMGGLGSADFNAAKADGKTTDVKETLSLNIGGGSANGSDGGVVTVVNDGLVSTKGTLASGIFAQSVGGGGGAAIGGNSIKSAEIKLGGSIGIAGGKAGNGQLVDVTNNGLIVTEGKGAIGIIAQSVGGGGGVGTTAALAGTDKNDFDFALGGSGGAGGKGGEVKVTVVGDIVTSGEQAHGVFAQSVGGGGGLAGDASGQSSNTLAIGGFGGDGGDGGNVTVTRTGKITTTGRDSIAIIAQSVGGGGGFGGAGVGRFDTSNIGLDGTAVAALSSPTGTKGTSGIVKVVQDGAIETSGQRSHGLFGQSVAGGGGAGGANDLAKNASGAGSNGGLGDASAIDLSGLQNIKVTGASSYGVFGQSAAGQGLGRTVTLRAANGIIATGADSVAAYGESSGKGGQDDIKIKLDNGIVTGGSGTGIGVMFVGGKNNRLTNGSTLSALSDLAILGEAGNEFVDNTGIVINNIDLAAGANGILNQGVGTFRTLDFIKQGTGNLFTNDGLFDTYHVGRDGVTAMTGNFVQNASGKFRTDINLTVQKTDRLDATGTGNFAGTAPLNFLSLDKLFDEYTIATAPLGMVDSGFTPTFRPTIGFNFTDRIDNGTDLILYADKPTFLSIAQRPASNISDPNAFAMAQYLDTLEGAFGVDNPSARLLNMLRFLPDEKTFGEVLMRLTPHYAAQSIDLFSKMSDDMARQSGSCMGPHVPTLPQQDPCLWLEGSDAKSKSNFGANRASPESGWTSWNAGALTNVNTNWSVGGSLGYSQFTSKIASATQLLSASEGDFKQASFLANYQNDQGFANFASTVGFGSLTGSRDTTIPRVESIEIETEAQILLPGVGDRVDYREDVANFGITGLFGYTFEASSGFYVRPQVELKTKLLLASIEETGDPQVAFAFDDAANFYLSATPMMEFGIDSLIADSVHLEAFVRGGLVLSPTDAWEISGGFQAAGSAAPKLKLQQEIAVPEYTLNVGFAMSDDKNWKLGADYRGVFSEGTKQHSVSATLGILF
jgi:hypothetical protein